MNSMTGFGVGTSAEGGTHVVVEIRAVNHRSLDLKVRGRELSAEAEVELGRLVRRSLRRGAVQVSVAVRADGAEDADGPVARLMAAQAMLREAGGRLGLPDEGLLAAAFLVQSPAFASSGASPLAWKSLRPALEQGLSALLGMREKEGAALADDFAQRVGHLQRIVEELGRRAEGVPREAAHRLRERIGILLAATAPQGAGADLPPARPELDPSRLAQEVALLADRMDVSEELTRLRVHLSALCSFCEAEQGEPAGRQIEFLLQEIGRELHTTGSKAQDVGVTKLVIEARAEVEKMREQAQNVE
jgi:uncharacterized protein YicC (UPF0701 family)